MTAKLALTLLATLGISGAAFATVPAMAAGPAHVVMQAPICDSNSTPTSDAIDDNAGEIAARLAEMGVKGVTGVDDFGNCVRAYITSPDGTTSMAYFTPDTLQRINTAG